MTNGHLLRARHGLTALGALAALLVGSSVCSNGHEGRSGLDAGAAGADGAGNGGSDAGGGNVAPGAGGAPPTAACTAVPKLKLTRVAKTDGAAVYVTQPTESAPLFVVRREGLIQVVVLGALLETPFLDLRRSVLEDAGERGLLGLAFHPQYDDNGRFFVYYTRRGNDPLSQGQGGDLVIAEGKRGATPERAEPSLTPLVVVAHSAHGNHNGGMMAFGKDGLLYAGIGDGGAANDPFKAGQNLRTDLGKMLRIDVDDPRARPTGNMPEPAGIHVWAIGLRNPWRWSFDRMNGDLYIGDVGQGDWEEVHVVPAAEQKAGLNFGWSVMEGTHCFGAPDCDRTGKLLPLAEYENPPLRNGQNPGRSVIGGFVYRGRRIPCLAGRYLYGDHNTNQVWSFVQVAGQATSEVELTADLASDTTRIQGLASFGEDALGELYLGDIVGNVYRIDPE